MTPPFPVELQNQYTAPRLLPLDEIHVNLQVIYQNQTPWFHMELHVVQFIYYPTTANSAGPWGLENRRSPPHSHFPMRLGLLYGLLHLVHMKPLVMVMATSLRCFSLWFFSASRIPTCFPFPRSSPLEMPRAINILSNGGSSWFSM